MNKSDLFSMCNKLHHLAITLPMVPFHPKSTSPLRSALHLITDSYKFDS